MQDVTGLDIYNTYNGSKITNVAQVIQMEERMVEHIEPVSFEVVKVFVPGTYSSKDILDVESMEVNLDVYLYEVKAQNRFTLSGAIDY